MQINVGTEQSPLMVSRIGFGCWPIAGVTTLGTTWKDSCDTLQRAHDLGINFFDTAYCYGFAGEADRLLRESLGGSAAYEEIVIATKVGMHYTSDQQRIIDGRPETLRREIDHALERLGRQQVDVLYLHLPDPKVPIEQSAEVIAEAVKTGKARFAGVSNVDAQQLQQFRSVCEPTVLQLPHNMLQTDNTQLLSSARSGGIATAVYWVLMKGLLAGKMPRDHQLAEGDRRREYDIYNGDAWHQAQDLLDLLRTLAADLSVTVAQLVVAWTLARNEVSVCLCGAKRPEQIEETSAALELVLTPEVISAIDGKLVELGQPLS